MAMHSRNGKCVFGDRSLELQRDPEFLRDLIGKMCRASLDQVEKHGREQARAEAALAAVLDRLSIDSMPGC